MDFAPVFKPFKAKVRMECVWCERGNFTTGKVYTTNGDTVTDDNGRKMRVWYNGGLHGDDLFGVFDKSWDDWKSVYFVKETKKKKGG